jgi:protein-tyrosine phosphatase
LRHRLTAAGIDAHVHSAGLLSGGQPASAHGVDLLHERGIDLSAHRSRGMDPALLRGADLIIAMAREHVREAVVRAPDVFPRTFTLKELVRRGGEVGPRLAEQPMHRWLSYVHAGRTTRELLGTSTEDDVADPIGRPRADYERMITELDRLLDRAFALIWGAEARQQRTEQEWAS